LGSNWGRKSTTTTEQTRFRTTGQTFLKVVSICHHNQESVYAMDSKSPMYTSEELPPPYSPTAGTATTAATAAAASQEFNPSSLTSHLQIHLSSIPERLRQSQQARGAQQVARDTVLLDCLVPIVEEFLAGLGDQPHATLFLVPDAAVPQNAVLSGIEDLKRAGEAVQVSKVAPTRKGADEKINSSSSGGGGGDLTWTPGREFSDWGRWDDGSTSSSAGSSDATLLWWRDEDTARRLASYLQPAKAKKQTLHPATVDLQTPVQVAVEQALPSTKGKRSLGFGWGKRRNEAPATPEERKVAIPPPPTAAAAAAAVSTRDGVGEDAHNMVDMTVAAQEVAFSSENAFGLWESTSGWAVVVTVVVR
jgi:hypothetical protein